MRKKRFSAAILLVVVLCFVSGVGYGEEKTMEQRREFRVQQASALDFYLLASKVNYIMKNPNDFLDITCSYTTFDITSVEGLGYDDLNLPEDFVTTDKLFIIIRDHRDVLSGETDLDSLELFGTHLLGFFNGSVLGAFFLYPYDIVAIFYSKGDIPQGYFYQGEYHLWEE